MIDIRRISTTRDAVEPVTADQFLAWARITDESERPTAERLITVARLEVEQYTGLVLVPGEFVITTSAAYRIELPLMPITSINGVQMIDSLGAMQPLDADAYVSLLTVSPALLRVTAAEYGTAGVEVTVTAGYLNASETPEDIKQAVLDVALLHYQHRDDPDLLERVRAYLSVLHLVYGIVQI